MSNNERYQRNKRRVFEIMGISVEDRRYNCHHIIGRDEYRRNKEFWDKGTPGGWFDVDGKANLFPVLIRDHEWINERIGSNQPPRKKRRRK
jgi:hypothetical protein